MEEIKKEDIRKDFTMFCEETFWLILQIIVSNKWKINSLDVKSALLQGQPIKITISLKTPKEVETNNLWKLSITVYDFCDTQRAWYLKVKKVPASVGAKKSKFDKTIFYWYNSKLEEVLSCHVN